MFFLIWEKRYILWNVVCLRLICQNGMEMSMIIIIFSYIQYSKGMTNGGALTQIIGKFLGLTIFWFHQKKKGNTLNS